MQPTDAEDRARSLAWTAAAGLIAGAAGAVGDPRVFPMHPAWPILAGLACAVVAVWVGRQRAATPAGIFRAVCWLTAGGWVAWCYRYGPWHPTTWEALVCGMVVLGLASLAFPIPDDDTQPQPVGGKLGRAVVPPAAADWEDRLDRIGKAPGATVTELEPWPSRAGYTLAGDFGGDGSTWQALKAREAAIASTLRLPTGCGVEVGPGDHTGAFTISVSTRDTLAETITYTDTETLSGNGPIPIGRHRDGTVAEVTVREACTMVVSETGGGKSNYLHTLTAGYVRCPDILVWHVDLGGAGLALPWIAPWLDSGLAGQPVVDWVAPTVAEAVTMTEMALQIIMRRRVAYRRLMTQANTDVVPCTHDLPQIRIINDETAEAAGVAASPRLRDNLVRIIQLGRAAGVRVDLSALRATNTVLPTDAERQIRVRAMFGVEDEAEVGHALGWTTRLSLGAATHPGVGWWRPGRAGAIRAFRTPHTAKPATIAAIARQCQDRRPALDPASLAVPLRDAYLSRWDRVVPLLDDDTDTQNLAPARPVTSRGGVDLGVLDAKIATARLSTMPAEVVDGRFAALAEQLEDDRADRWAQAAAILDRAGPDGMSGAALAQALADAGQPVPSQSLYDWLGRAAVKVRHGQYVAPRHTPGAR